ncbi:MAG: GNAT family N-acetyltransferase [Aeromicrobium sp.]
MEPEDRELVDQWIATWLHVRGITSSELDGWPLVHVGSATRETELICVDPGVPEFTALMRHVAGDPRAMLTVVGRDVGRYLVTRRPDDVRVDRDDETLMSTTFADVPIPRLDDELTFRWDIEAHRLTYTVESGDRIAAVGTVGVLGGTATFDAVETMPDFQRRGLGRHVMATLTTQAMGRGATSGVLAASAPGRQLYLSLGWDVRLEMLSLMGS